MRFSTFAASVHGKKYRERGLPCQDSSDALEFDNVQAIAVADGHGGRDYFRSDIGSRLAVQVAFEQIKKFCADIKDSEIFPENSIRYFELELWEEWQRAVKDDWSKNPFNVEEERWQGVSDKYKARYTSADERYIPVAYGTTLLLAVSIGWQVLLVQIGDGSCVVLQRDGEFKSPVPPDAESFGYVTTSLCDADGYKKFRHVVLDCAEDSPLTPVAIFLSTDGLDDCYPIGDNEKYLYKLYADTVIDSMIGNGFDKTRESLRLELLPYMTEHGSNDDISLAYLVTDDLYLLKQAVEEQSSPPVEEKSSPPVEEKSSPPVEEQSSPPVEEQSSPPVEKQSSPPVEKQSSPPVEKQSSPPVEEQSSPPAEEQSSPPVEKQSSPTVEEQTSPTVKEQSSPPVEEVQAKVAEQAAQARERLLPLWWEERRKQRDKQP
ncbi:MAG: protein phosphatase 2C domain-containing protein [Selenomonadaceae bacterium]|nr:protein phosphatase 2C domain-containing protein [Selenomonadaceae bacterium]